MVQVDIGKQVHHQEPALPREDLFLVLTLKLEQSEVDLVRPLHQCDRHVPDSVLNASYGERVTDIDQPLGDLDIANGYTKGPRAADLPGQSLFQDLGALHLPNVSRTGFQSLIIRIL